MQRSSDSKDEVPPITALEAFVLGNSTYVLVGSGECLTLIETQNGTFTTKSKTIGTYEVFDSQAIHGISAVRILVNDQNCVHLDVLVYGGHSLAFIRARFSTDGSNSTICKLESLAKTYLTQWILIGKHMLSEGASSSYAILLTSHNVLMHSFLEPQSQSLTVVKISDQVPAFLYSADIFAVSNKKYIIASGTAFGEILTWTCTYNDEDRTWHTRAFSEFSGHKGSIFGLSISPAFSVMDRPQRILASSSDDRTIRLWDMSRVDSEPGFCSEDSSRPTFTTCSIDLCTIWAHDSRIWKVDVEIQELVDPTCGSITSIGEDGQVICWHMDVAGTLDQGLKLTMKNVQNDRYHVGKNIWAYCKLGDIIFSGGADGQIILRNKKQKSREERHFSQSFEHIMKTVSNDNIFPKASALKSYRLVRGPRRQFLACADKGTLLKASFWNCVGDWCRLAQGTSNTSIILASRVDAGYAFFIQPASAMLTAINIENGRSLSLCNLPQASISRLDVLASVINECSTAFCLATTYHGDHDIILSWFEISENVADLKYSRLRIPDTFMLTSIYYDSQTELVVCGSRAGAVSVYTSITSQTETAEPAACLRHVHGSDTVTSIQFLERMIDHDGSTTLLCLTTGRDGHFGVLSISMSNTSAPIIRNVHRSESFLGRHLEGVYLLRQPDETYDIVLYGFHADNFVVWNETKQMHLMEVACGGAHREWDFNIQTTSNKTSEGVLVWTKGKTVNFCTRDLTDHSIVQSGGHGREIKALAVHRRSDSSWLIATGSEDTNIRLFDYRLNKLRSISVLTKHKAGLQDLRFSDDGQHLMSAAGMEELLAWRLRSVPMINLGVVCTTSLVVAGSAADARLMSLDMITVEDVNKSTDFTYHILAAFSSGKIKHIAYKENDEEASFSVLAQIDMGSICLTQSQFLSPSSALIAGTNGFITNINLKKTGVTPTLQATSAHKIHQNNITTLSVHRLTGESNSTLIITGGDDDALALTVQSGDQYKTTIIPGAHAAALTALAVHKLPMLDGNAFVVLTVGNDQRLNIWMVRFVGQEGIPMVSVEFVDSRYTNVADSSQIAILGSEEDADGHEIKALVVGVGMEIMKVRASGR